METPLTPLEFARRTRTLHSNREARRRRRAAPDVRAVLRSLRSLVGRTAAAGRRPGDRVAYIAPEHARAARVVLCVCRSSAPCWCPINYRLTAARLRLHHHALRARRSSARTQITLRPSTACATSCRASSHFVALEGAREGWLDYERMVADAPADFTRPRDRRKRPPDDQLHERHDVAAEGRDDHAPQRLHERHRHAAARADDVRLIATCGRCRCFTRTAGRSPGSSPPSAARTSACGRWIRREFSS